MLKLEVKPRGTNLPGFDVRRRRTAFWSLFAEFSFLCNLSYRKTDLLIIPFITIYPKLIFVLNRFQLFLVFITSRRNDRHSLSPT